MVENVVLQSHSLPRPLRNLSKNNEAGGVVLFAIFHLFFHSAATLTWLQVWLGKYQVKDKLDEEVTEES